MIKVYVTVLLFVLTYGAAAYSAMTIECRDGTVRNQLGALIGQDMCKDPKRKSVVEILQNQKGVNPSPINGGK